MQKVELTSLTGNHDKFPTLPNGKRDVIHDYNHADGWKQMEAVLQTGKTKAIGVSNVRLLYSSMIECFV